MSKNEKFCANADELNELAKPMIQFLKKNYHPHCAIIVTDNGVSLHECALSIPQNAN